MRGIDMKKRIIRLVSAVMVMVGIFVLIPFAGAAKEKDEHIFFFRRTGLHGLSVR